MYQVSLFNEVLGNKVRCAWAAVLLKCFFVDIYPKYSVLKQCVESVKWGSFPWSYLHRLQSDSWQGHKDFSLCIICFVPGCDSWNWREEKALCLHIPYDYCRLFHNNRNLKVIRILVRISQEQSCLTNQSHICLE